MNLKQIAQAIRPTIDLMQQQATANLIYKELVNKTLLRDYPRMSEAKAEERAQRATLKYVSEQQRYCAETIERTELTFAYNRGAHESMRQAVANRCEKVWETAETNRACGRCRDLSGKVVGFDDKFFDSRFDLDETPPLHPRCRCVIIYRKVEVGEKMKTPRELLADYHNQFGRKFPIFVAENLKKEEFVQILQECLNTNSPYLVNNSVLLSLNHDELFDAYKDIFDDLPPLMMMSPSEVNNIENIIRNCIKFGKPYELDEETQKLINDNPAVIF